MNEVRKILITGGAGFIGSHIADRLCKEFPESHIAVLDKMTYASDFRYISDLVLNRRIELVVGDVCDYELCRKILKGVDLVVHAAAESHVDNSFGNSLLFTSTNTLGTHALIEACRSQAVERIIHVSTDEVYGEVLEGSATEDSMLRPTNPYSASKAAAEMIIFSYLTSFKQPILLIRANNIFGVRQYPEKIIPSFTLRLINGNKVKMHGDGSHKRHYLAVQDFVEAVVLLVYKGVSGEVYNIGSDEEYSNMEIATMLCDIFDKRVEEQVEFVSDRLFNDRRYSVASEKIKKLGWYPRHTLADELPKIAAWYRENSALYGAMLA